MKITIKSKKKSPRLIYETGGAFVYLGQRDALTSPCAAEEQVVRRQGGLAAQRKVPE
jgi:hypothetical protein